MAEGNSGKDRPSTALLTRYNVPWKSSPTQIPSDDWHIHRWELFSTFTLPSVLGQRLRPDAWLIFIAHTSPPSLLHKLAELEEAHEFIHIERVEGRLRHSDVIDRLRARVDCTRRGHLTARLDNDDAIHERYFQLLLTRVREETSDELVTFNPLRGFQTDGSRVYRKVDPGSPFLAVLDPQDPPRIVAVSGSHDHFWTVSRVRQLTGTELWLQTIHDRNTANQRLGIASRADLAHRGFPHVPHNPEPRLAYLQRLARSLARVTWYGLTVLRRRHAWRHLLPFRRDADRR